MNVIIKLISNRVLHCILKPNIWESNTSVMNVIIKLMSNRILNCMLKRSTWESNTDVMNVNTRADQRNV